MRLLLDLGKGEGHRLGIAIRRERIDPWTAWVAQSKEFGYLVKGLAGGIVDGAADIPIGKASLSRLRCIEVCVSSGDHQGQRPRASLVKRGVVFLWRGPGQFLLLEQHGVDVPLEMIDRDQRLSQSECQRLGVGDADEKCAGEPRPLGHGNGGEVRERDTCFGERGVDHRDDIAQVLA